jgi:ureidoglycolate hydrolase
MAVLVTAVHKRTAINFIPFRPIEFARLTVPNISRHKPDSTAFIPLSSSSMICVLRNDRKLWKRRVSIYGLEI